MKQKKELNSTTVSIFSAVKASLRLHCTFLLLSGVVFSSFNSALPAGDFTNSASDYSNDPANPAMRPIQDVPGLPRVLLMGDSISIGYTLPVR
ncbi:MAG: hypothetical protein WCR20_12460, partial [Verrucomicrobiota bacterium]